MQLQLKFPADPVHFVKQELNVDRFKSEACSFNLSIERNGYVETCYGLAI